MAGIIILAIAITGLLILSGTFLYKDRNSGDTLGGVFLLLGILAMCFYTFFTCYYYRDTKTSDKLKKEAIEYGYAEYVTIQTNKIDKPVFEWRWKENK